MTEYELMIVSPKDNARLHLHCALGVEIRDMRKKNGLTLLSMSDALGWQVSKLSKIENVIGELTDGDDAKAIDDFCKKHGYSLPARPELLSRMGYMTDRNEKFEALKQLIDKNTN